MQRATWLRIATALPLGLRTDKKRSPRLGIRHLMPMHAELLRGWPLSHVAGSPAQRLG